MRDGFQIYDSHTHLGTAKHSGRQQSAEKMLKHMDAHGIERAIVIPFPVTEDRAKENAIVAAAAKAHSDRFTAVYYADPFVSEDEMRSEFQQTREAGFRGLKLQPQYSGLNPLSERASVFFGLANEFQLPVICHTGAGAPYALPSLLISPARQFPDLPIIAGHCGSPIYFQEAIVAAQVCPNIYLEVSTLMPHQVLEVLRNVDASRVMAGSDLPENTGTEIGKILELGVPPGVKAQVLWSTPRRVFDGAC